MTNMKTLVVAEPRSMVWQQRSVPTPAAHEVLIKPIAAGICGTDIHAWAGNQPFFSYPRVLGHELCGEVVALGAAAQGFQPGQRVALIPYVACQRCDACLSGKTNCCEQISVIGVHQDGGFCEFLSVPDTNLLAVDDVAPEAAALIEPFAISAHAVRRAALVADEQVLVVGAGPIGLGVAAIAAAAGAQVVVADTSAQRRAHVAQQLQLATIDPLAADFTAALRAEFGGRLAAKVIDATGSPAAMNSAVQLIRHGGTIVFVGLHKGDLVIPDTEFHKKETTLLGSRNATREDFDKVRALMASGQLRADMMLNRHYDFSTLAETFEPGVINNPELIKGVIHFAR
ncbi:MULTISPECIES: zinc-binding alcohol dehydrogenase family protein [Pantoea]|jgi:Threonine dehydrogenase and related Zn-dependent dehydrogenases|uniref:Galactonate oxidoreductase n=2 Tax=Pantoea dispersa TaxID=59814 RepID=A0A8E1V7I9_9GAMM|nr:MULTISPECIES: zinc-binding alcohol dehydrogenase family protein [Pantoea]KTR88347.1 galactonate oxidoreductase [Pantoea dispersa]KTS21278.1 galactonate oxidoreductase [Pantoea dispersa]KTS62560.1 galactonate oxidoreductase [Pantoea dispersa]KTS67301.1 galactonate oxidoreductase [Pantoea dispersa]MDI6957790.1 zinc-binding alcohol dehydrogenase family protein [Pantoea sp. Pa-EAmG]